MDGQVNRVPLPTDQISPRVLESFLYNQGLKMPKDYRLPKRYVHDYELELFVQSEGGMFIDEVFYPIQAGDVVFRRPGQLTEAVMPYSCYLICFDLANNTSKSSTNFSFCEGGGVKGEFQDYYINPILEKIPNVFHPDSTPKYMGLFDRVLNESINPTEISPMVQKTAIIQLLNHLYQDASDPLNNRAIRSSPYGKAIQKAVNYIKENIRTALTLNELADLAGFSPSYFHRVFHDVMGITPNDYITKLRLERAKELLIRSNDPVHKVALECGINNIPYFSYIFKKRQGITPMEFRARHSFHM